MEKITKEQFDNADFKSKVRKGGKREKRGISMIIELSRIKINEGIFIGIKEWKSKTSPSAYIHQLYRPSRSEKKFTVRLLNDDSGWYVLRIK